MKGDFSRLGPWPDRSVEGVWLQEGRPLLDADFNAAHEISRRHTARTVDAFLGGAAAPAADSGFAVTVRSQLWLNATADARQTLVFHSSPSLPFRGGEVYEEVEIERLFMDGGAVLEGLELGVWREIRHHDRHDPPYLVELELTVPAGASGVILQRPGVVAVAVAADRSIVLGLAAGSHAAVSGWTAPERGFRLHLLHMGGFYRLLLDGKVAAEWEEPKHPPEHPSSDHALVLGGASADMDFGHLHCGLEAVRVWTLRRESTAPLEALPQAWLSADIDLGRLDGKALHDRSDHGNDLHASGRTPPTPTTNLTLGRGRYFVSGALLVNAEDRRLGSRLLDAPPSDRAHAVYLESWEEGVDALADPSLRETALGGTDTIVAAHRRWRIGAVHGRDAASARAAFNSLERRLPGRAGFEHAVGGSDNTLYRVEVHHSGWANAWPLSEAAAAAAFEVEPVEPGAIRPPVGTPSPAIGTPFLVFSDDGDHWLVRCAPASTPDGWVLDGAPEAWPSSPLHALPIASFKWSSDNAAQTYEVARIVAAQDAAAGPIGRVQLMTAGFNGIDLQPGDWMELAALVDPVEGQGRLYPLLDFDSGLLQADLADWDGGPSIDGNLRLRRWGPTPIGAEAGTGGFGPVIVQAGDLALDHHVTVRFGAHGYFTGGDFWTLPLREGDDLGGPSVRTWAPVPPQGPGRTLTLLAEIEHGPVVTDRRRIFRDLPSLSLDEDGPGDPLDLLGPREIARWLARHAPDVVLLSAADTPPAGFVQTESIATTPGLGSARWRQLGGEGDRPAGPGQMVFAEGSVIFLADGGRSWRWRAPSGWSRLPDQPSARVGFAAVASGPFVLVVGGSAGLESTLCHTLAVLDPDEDEWSEVQTQCTPAFRPAVAVWDGKLLVSGGRNGVGVPLNRFEAIDIASGHHIVLPPMAVGRAGHAMAARAGEIQVFGGIDLTDEPIDLCETYHPMVGRWRPAAPLPSPAQGLSVLAVDGDWVMTGGGRTEDERSGLWLKPGQDDWVAIDRLPFALGGGAIVLDIAQGGPRRILALGESAEGDLGALASLDVDRRFAVIAPAEAQR